MKAALLNNRYRIIKTLGRGGFGETYLTEDTHMPSRRKCVLKQLKPIVKHPKIPLWMKERFQREAAILEELGEVNDQIPRLYAYFSEGDKFYLVQEWIEGLTLDQYWEQEGNLHRDEVRQILVQLLPVLEDVHSRQIIHRDIKPENIIIRQSDRQPVLIDFGAVKEAMATEVNNSSSSVYSASIGTPGYMSSEQAAGRPVYSSDLYSLALTAIFLLTGKSPHELETNPSNGEIIWQEYATNVDAELISVLDRAIRFHPRDRFSSAREMLLALQANAKTSPSSKRATIRVSPSSKKVTSNPFPHTQREPTAAVDLPYGKTPQKRDWLVNTLWFILIATGVGVGTFAAGFAVIYNWLSPQSQPTPQARVETSNRQPDLFSPILNKPEKQKQSQSESSIESESPITEAEIEATESNSELDATELETAENPESKVEQDRTDTDSPEVAVNQPSTETQPLPQPETELNLPIVTTGSSESLLVNTLGQPTFERQDWQENSRILVYQDVVPNLVNLTYRSDSEGKIRQTDIALDQSVSIGAMQDTLAKLLNGNAPAGVKEKLRRVYTRQTKFSFFKVGELEGKVERDSKDRINISVYETRY